MALPSYATFCTYWQNGDYTEETIAAVYTELRNIFLNRAANREVSEIAVYNDDTNQRMFHCLNDRAGDLMERTYYND